LVKLRRNQRKRDLTSHDRNESRPAIIGDIQGRFHPTADWDEPGQSSLTGHADRIHSTAKPSGSDKRLEQ
jgi:hypothetical protein